MALTEIYGKNEIWQDFLFHVNGGANGSWNESVCFTSEGYQWHLKELRWHFTTSCTSVGSLTAFVSSILGTGYSAILVSQALSGITDYRIEFDPPYQLLSDDQLVIQGSLASAQWHWGLVVLGEWALSSD